MSQWTLYACSGAAVIAIALHGLFARDGVVKRIIAANLLGSGVFLILVALANRAPLPFADAVPHALVLTGIVISVSATALALALARSVASTTPDHATSPRDASAPPAPSATDWP